MYPNSFVRESNSTVNEDVWLCGRAAEVVAQETTALRKGLAPPLSMVPAPHYEAMQFSVDTEMHAQPFGVHQFWFHLKPNYELRVRIHVMMAPLFAHICLHRPFAPDSFHFVIRFSIAQAMFEACPEALEIIPRHFCDHWPSAVCTADVNRAALMPATECDWAICEGPSAKETSATSVLYAV